jgi:hypothetical protein
MPYAFRLAIANRLYTPLVPPSDERPKMVFRLDPWTVAKRTHEFSFEREIQAMEFIRLNTTIPIPKIQDAWQEGEWGWIVMNYISGERADLVWPTLSPQQQANTATQVRDVLRQLRALHPPRPGLVGSCSGGPGFDDRIDNQRTFGPFESVGEFHEYLYELACKAYPPSFNIRATVLSKAKQRDEYPVVFSHADFHAANVLLDPVNGTLQGVLDWEMAGWYPAYWEYRKAKGKKMGISWIDIIREATGDYFEEEQRDQTLVDFQGI